MDISKTVDLNKNEKSVKQFQTPKKYQQKKKSHHIPQNALKSRHQICHRKQKGRI